MKRDKDRAAAEAASILKELSAIGIDVASLMDLPAKTDRASAFVPVLLKRLPRVEDLAIKETVVRALSFPQAGNEVAAALLKEFCKRSGGLQLVAGNSDAVIV